MNPTPMTRPDMVLLLQPWSTAITQTTNSSMAMLPRTLSHMTSPFVIFTRIEACGCDRYHYDLPRRACSRN